MNNEIIISTQDTEIRSMLFKMMGRGLSVSSKGVGQFLLKKEDLIDIVEKIRQRVTIQNNCSMSDFYGEFTFADGVKDRISSYEKFSEYRSLNREICVTAKFSMAFLVQFRERGIEKQSIDITFEAPNLKTKNNSYPLLRTNDKIFGSMEIEIEYTDVTWANDIKNIFNDYMETHLNKFPSRQKILDLLSDRFSYALIVPISFMLIVMMPLLTSNQKDKYGKIIENINTNNLEILNKIDLKLNSLILKENNAITWHEFITPTLTTVSIAIIYYLAPKIIGNFPISGSILSSEAQKKFEKYDKIRSNQNYLAYGAIAVSILCSIAASNIDRLTVNLANLFF